MSPIVPKIALLAMASSVLAVPYGGGEQHGHGHHNQHQHLHQNGGLGTGNGSPFDIVNATGVYPTGSGFAASTGIDVLAAAAASADSSSTTCTDSVVYTTMTNRKTHYVTATAEGLAPRAYGAKKWRRPRTSTTATSAAAVSTSDTPIAVATSTSSTSTIVDVATTSSSTSVAAVVSVATSTTSAAASTSVTSTSTTGKRGVAYNDASLCALFENSAEVSWGYNWGQGSSGLASSFNYVPMLWGTGSGFTNGWSAAAQSAINSGSTHLLSFNEPDLSSQSNISPAAAAAAYKTYMQPFAGKAKLGAPAVTNGANGMGLDWLSAFLTECSGCTIDFVPIHWYSGSGQAAYFKQQVANATAVAGGRPVWVTEFGCTDGSSSDISAFLQEVMPWMDKQSYVERYAYFMVATGYLVSSATALSSYGSTYLSYTA